ncbi:hypothetical protein ABTY98_05160 [Streptomyces sp. NPDC096040]|uniref:hypothetical protein n=1 Tax=Streptomyces sp. NPDC096040 TaxID=3155541 RepID=UPI00331E5B7F
MRRIGLAVGAVLVVGALAVGCTSTSGTDAAGDSKGSAAASTPAPKKSAAVADVKLVKQGWENHPVWGDHAYVVHWTLTNTQAKAGNYFAGIDFLDRDGDVLGSTGVTAEKLGPGKTAKGDASPLPAEITNGKMAEIKTARVSEVQRLDY